VPKRSIASSSAWDLAGIQSIGNQETVLEALRGKRATGFLITPFGLSIDLKHGKTAQ
jgi:hypothetical protein